MADRDLAGLEVLRIGAPDRVGPVLVQLGRIDASDVVCLEDLRVEHAGMLTTPLSNAWVLGLNRPFAGFFRLPASFIDLWQWNASWRPFCSSISSIRPRSSQAPTQRSRAGA